MRRITRREFLGLTLGVVPMLHQAQLEEAEQLVRPNILFILSDDQPFYTMQYMPKTLARLSPGMQFTRAYITSPVCSPSRATILTGLMSHNHRVTLNKNAAPRFNKQRHHNRTFGAILAAEAGYEAGYYGKWMNAYESIPAFEAPGFKSRRGGLNTWAVTLGNRSPVKANVDGVVKKTAQARHYETRWFGQLSKAFIQNATEPWLCFASIKAPHSPYDPSPAHKGELNGLALPGRENFNHYDENKPRHVRSEPEIGAQAAEHLRNVYQGKREELLDLDDAIDDLCSVVDWTDTYVIFMSDNGFHLGEHRLYSKGGPYEEAVRTPLFVRGPAVVESSQSAALVCNADIAPTILEIAGLDPGPDGSGMDGRSLLPLMVGAAEPEWRTHLLLEMPQGTQGEYPPWRAITDAGGGFPRLYAEYETGERELYRMDTDPYQLTNVASEAEEAEIHELSMRLDAMRQAEGEALRAAEEGIAWT